MFRIRGEKRPRWLVPAVVAGLIVLLVLVLRGGGKKETRAPKEEQPPVTAQVLTVEPSSVADEITASGTVRPVMESSIAPKIMSNVAAVYVREGDRVRKGQVLIRLESRDLQAQVSQAQAAVAAAQATSQKASTGVMLQTTQSSTGVASAIARLRAANEQLSIVKEGPRKQQKAQAQLAVAQAQAQLNLAKIEYDRMKRLFEQDVVAKQRLDAAQTSYEIAQAQFESAKQQSNLTEEGSRQQEIRAGEEEVRQAEEAVRMAKASGLQNRMSRRDAQVAASQVAQARAGLEFAKTQLGYAVITSPISGIVTKRLVDPGDTVSPGVPMIAVEGSSLYRLEASVPADSVQDLYIGRTVGVTVNSGTSGNGRVSVISPEGDPASRKFTVKVDLPSGIGARSGDFGRISYATGYASSIVIPQQAIHDEGGLTFVYVVDHDNRARMQVIKAGKGVDGGVEVVSGLNAGDRVILSADGPLSDGVPVKARRQQ